MKSFSFILFLLLMGTVVGCGVKGLPTVPVKGKVTFAGQTPPAVVSLTFAPLETEHGLPRIPGAAVVQPDGSYAATTDQAGNGLIPGRYAVNIDCWKEQPTMEKPGVSHLPAGFRPPELTVKSGGGAVTYDLDIPAAP